MSDPESNITTYLTHFPLRDRKKILKAPFNVESDNSFYNRYSKTFTGNRSTH